MTAGSIHQTELPPIQIDLKTDSKSVPQAAVFGITGIHIVRMGKRWAAWTILSINLLQG